MIEDSVCWFCSHCIQRVITNSDQETGNNWSCILTSEDLHSLIVHECSAFDLDKQFIATLPETGEIK